jgi:hypothetical protein
MSRTLFWYIFLDLLRIFFVALGVLTGIMSFGGLLRPLTEHGLAPGQVAKMLTYFWPAILLAGDEHLFAAGCGTVRDDHGVRSPRRG